MGRVHRVARFDQLRRICHIAANNNSLFGILTRNLLALGTSFTESKSLDYSARHKSTVGKTTFLDKQRVSVPCNLSVMMDSTTHVKILPGRMEEMSFEVTMTDKCLEGPLLSRHAWMYEGPSKSRERRNFLSYGHWRA